MKQWVLITAFVFFVIWITFAFSSPDDQCDFYLCPKGKIAWPAEGGVVLEGIEKADCDLSGRGTRKAANEFEKKHVGKYIVLDCKKVKQ